MRTPTPQTFLTLAPCFLLSQLFLMTSAKAASEACKSHNDQQTQAVCKRWIILFLFMVFSASNGFQWLEYAIISDIVVDFYKVSDLAVDWLSMTYMLMYIPLILPATWMLDKYGLRTVALVGSFGNAAGSWIKCASATPDRFWVTFAGQIVAAASSVCVLGIPPRLAAVWFGANQVSTACALGVLGNQFGNGMGFLLPPMLVQFSNDTQVLSHAFQRMFFISAAFNTALFLLILVFFSDHPPLPPSAAQLAAVESSVESNYLHSLRELFSNRNFVLLLITYGINVGAFYAISTLLNQMVVTYFPGEEVNIGRIGLTIVVAGMVGSVLCGIWLDKTHTYKITTLFTYACSCLGMLIFTFTVSTKMWVVFIAAGLFGFFMAGYLPLGFELGVELTYPIPEGTVSGLLNASAQLFGIILTLSMGALIQNLSIFACNITIVIALAIGTIITALIKADLKRQTAGHNKEKELEGSKTDE